MEKDFVRIPREVKTRLERIEIESMGLQEENAELKKQIEDLKSDARVGQELIAALNNTHDIVRR